MPNISLATLVGIPGVDNQTMTQSNHLTPNDCGAFAIVGAVGAQGVFPLEANLLYNNDGPEQVQNNVITAIGDNFSQLSAKVYTITGILNNTAVMPINPELLAAGNGYNSPAAMAKVAMDLGRPAPHINAQTAGFTILNGRYPNEQARCTAVVQADHINIDAGVYTMPGANDTHVVCVFVNGGLHWVAQGSDGMFYDPADGSINNAWAPQNTHDPMGANYTFAGLWLVIH